MKTVVVDDLMEWEEENEEDVYMDGPYYLSKDQEKELGKITFDRLNKLHGSNHIPGPDWKMDMFEIWEDGLCDIGSDEREIVLQSLCDVINKYGIDPY